MAAYPGQETAGAQVTDAVRSALAPAARYAALVTQTNPLGTADTLLSRPDVRAELTAALEAARLAAAAAVAQQWDISGAPDVPVREHLLADIDRQYGDIGRLYSVIRQAHASVPQRRFIPGVTPPGASPAIEAGNERAAAVRNAILEFASRAALRSRMTVAVAATAARAAVITDEGRARREAGEHVSKRWVSRKDGKVCHWCQVLDGVTIGLEESFLPYLGGAVDLTGHGHLTQPPKPYRGALQSPPLHPNCRCHLVLVREDGLVDDLETRPAETPYTRRPEVSTNQAPPSPPQFITAVQIRDMPEPRFRALTAFLRAAVHELGQVLSRLRGSIRP